ncbi:MAG: peptide-binding protein [Victivallales bacterium]|nr:peptide-binding protein [Victivallales bacterium]
MGKSLYANVILTILLAVVLVMGWAAVNTLDLMRLREESISKQLNNFDTKMGRMERALVGLGSASPRPMAHAAQDAGPRTPVEIANLEFFDPASESGGRRISAMQSQTKNMNYLINNESLVSSIWSLCFDSLADRNFAAPEKFEPMLAESWSLSEDKLTYTVKLRRGVLWHDFADPVSGRQWNDVEVTAHDFKFYVDVIKNPDSDCAPIRTYMIDLEGIEVVSDYEFKVRWSRKYFLSESMTLGLQPLPRHLYHAYDGAFDGKVFNDDHERNRIVVGCGPYRFAGWDKGQRIRLTRWVKYYGEKYGVAPTIKDIELRIIPNKNTQFQALTAGKIDEMSLTPDQWVNRTDTADFDPQKGHLVKIKYPGRVYRYIGYNLTLPMFQDRRVRQALTHLIDRERIIEEVYNGLARIITGGFFLDSVYNDKSIEPFPFSIERARELLAESGWRDSDGDGILDKDGQKFEFTILSPGNNPNYEKMLPMIKEDMAKAGIIVNIRMVDWAVFVQMLGQKNFEASICGWAMGLESDPYQLWHSSQADIIESSNHIGFKNAEADDLIEQIRVAFDLEERVKLCHKFHKILHDEQPYTFLFSPYSLIAQSRRYRNVKIFPIGIPQSIQWVPRDEQKSIAE